ncbi:MAG: hypothetical protein QOJ68_2856 [Blastococcus sp.]|jgi:hypothetical protein|nr:hypothetical protein [Blastococcus sp.]
MNHYYLEPQHTGRLLASERLINGGKDWQRRKDVLTSVVTTVMGWEMPPDVAAAADGGKKDGGKKDEAAAGASNGSGPSAN